MLECPGFHGPGRRAAEDKKDPSFDAVKKEIEEDKKEILEESPKRKKSSLLHLKRKKQDVLKKY